MALDFYDIKNRYLAMREPLSREHAQEMLKRAEALKSELNKLMNPGGKNPFFRWGSDAQELHRELRQLIADLKQAKDDMSLSETRCNDIFDL